MEISQNFVAFSEYMNFTSMNHHIWHQLGISFCLISSIIRDNKLCICLFYLFCCKYLGTKSLSTYQSKRKMDNFVPERHTIFSFFKITFRSSKEVMIKIVPLFLDPTVEFAISPIITLLCRGKCTVQHSQCVFSRF